MKFYSLVFFSTSLYEFLDLKIVLPVIRACGGHLVVHVTTPGRRRGLFRLFFKIDDLLWVGSVAHLLIASQVTLFVFELIVSLLELALFRSAATMISHPCVLLRLEFIFICFQ